MRRLVVALALLGAACDRGARPDPRPAASVTPTPVARPATTLERVELVKGGAATDALPMIIALHGLGDDARGFSRVFDGFEGPARVIVLQAPTRHGGGWSWFETRRASGSVTVNAEGLSAAAALIAADVRALVAARPTRGRPVVTGFSQGGMLSFTLAVQHGALFSRAVPVAGWLPEALWPESRPAAAAPIIALHGDRDDVLPIGPTRASVARLAELGLKVELREFTGVRHTISADERRELFASLQQ